VPILFSYVTRLFLARCAITVAGLTGLLLVFDLLANADAVVGNAGRAIAPILSYIALRLPEIAVLVMPLAILIASLAAFAQMAASQEMVAMRAAGMSIYRPIGIFLVGAALIAVGHFWLADRLVPETSGRLRYWAEQDYRGMPPSEAPRSVPAWFAAGRSLIHVGGSSVDGEILRDLTVVIRDAEGMLEDYFTASSARYIADDWAFFDVERPASGSMEVGRVERETVDLPITPARFSRLSGTPTELTFLELLGLSRSETLEARPDFFYAFWVHRKLAQPLGALVMVLIAAPVGLQVARRNTLLLATFAAIGAGFMFFVTERLLLAFGENGYLPAAVAAWTPAILFSVLAAWVLLELEN